MLIEWRKSSHSGSQSECVELSTNLHPVTLIRDSTDPDGPRLELGCRDLTSLITQVKSDRRVSPPRWPRSWVR